MDCLRLKKAAAHMLSGGDVLGDHPDIDWTRQVQQVYADALSTCINALVVADPRGDCVMRFHEFEALLVSPVAAALNPFPTLLTDFEVTKKPLLCARLVGYGYACSRFAQSAGDPLGFDVTGVAPLSWRVFGLDLKPVEVARS